MVRTLFKRELLSSSFLAKKGSSRILSILSTLLFTGLFVALICFVYYRLYSQLAIYKDFNRSFYTIVLFAVFLLGILFAVPTMHTVFFRNEKERIILGSRPVPRKDILLSKALFSLLKNALFLLVTYFPLSIVYGIQAQCGPLFYFLLIVLLPFFALLLTGAGLLLVMPYREGFRFLKRYPILAFVLTIAISFLLAYVYSLFLDLFVSLIQDSSLDMLFTTERMEAMSESARGLVPVSLLSSALLWEDGLCLLYFPLVAVGLSAIAAPLIYLYLDRYYRQAGSTGVQADYLALPVHLDTPYRALVKKELSLVLSRSDGFFSYISLVAVEPFLIYLVVSAINVIFSTGNFVFVQKLFPDFLLLIDSLLILLFLSIINATSSLSLKKEGHNITTMKTIPVRPVHQLLVKLFVPYSFSALSYLIALVVLVSTREIAVTSFLFLIPIGLVFLLALSFTTLRLDLKQKKSDILTVAVDFLLPVVFLVLSFVLTLLEPFKKQPYLSFYLSTFLLLCLLTGPLAFLFFHDTDRTFLRYNGGFES